jgi:hypothetical protein
MSDFSRTRGEGCLSDFALDRLMRGEGSGEAARAHLAGCEHCRARMAEIEAARAEFQKAAPSLPSLPADRGTARPRRRWAVWGGGGAALAAAAAAALILFVRGNDAGTRIKGGARIAFYVEHAGKMRAGKAGERVAPGDTVQLVYSSVDPFYGAILSVDGAGQVSRYFPEGDRATALPAGRDQSFPRSTQLDEVLGHETLYALFCHDAVALRPLEDALAAGRPPQAPGCRVERIDLEKTRP